MNDRRPLIFCVAGNFQQSVYYRRQYGFSQRDWHYVVSTSTLRGLQRPYYVRVGTFYERPNIDEIHQALIMSMAIEIPIRYLESRPE